MLNGKATIILLINGLKEKAQYKWMDVNPFWGNVKVELDSSNYMEKKKQI